MAGNDNKENDLVPELETGSNLTFPQTPAHLLKRSVSNVFKQSNVDEKDKLELSGNALDAPVKNTSPLRRTGVRQGRLPLASKDNNRANSFVLLQQQHQPPVKRDSSLHKKRKPFERVPLGLNDQLLANPRRLKKYGSVLGYNGLPKMKSLVLKDVGSGEEQGDDGHDDDDDDDDDDEGLLRLKLRDALDKAEKTKEVGGLFGNAGGLQQLIRDSKKDEEDYEDRDIEFCPPKHDPLPYIPDGHIPLLKEDIDKLTTFRSPYLIEDDCSRSGDEAENGFLDLEQIESGGEDEGIPDKSRFTVTKHVGNLVDHNIIELEPRYAGEGLTVDELNDLVVD